MADYGPIVIARMSLVTVCLLVAACGGSANSTSNSSAGATPSPTKGAHVNSVDACSLVTAAEASAAAGSTVTNLSAGAGAQTPGICVYGSSDGSTSVFVLAQVYPDTTTADSISPEQMAAVMNGQMGVTNAKSVQGIGDKAFEYTATSSSGGGIAIFVFKANVVLMIALSPTTDSAKVEALARAAVGRF
ncbi:MAG: DUF3558 domain-containing protein [Chloroflexi bacterium]|nr:MAG: DUF3558 domain-containing protein [Chloroflexota bacterium]